MKYYQRIINNINNIKRKEADWLIEGKEFVVGIAIIF